MAILSLKDVKKNFGITEIIRGVSLDIVEGEKHAIIGPNGAGKSTLFHLISGRYNLSAGSIRFKEQQIENPSILIVNSLAVNSLTVFSFVVHISQSKLAESSYQPY